MSTTEDWLKDIANQEAGLANNVRWVSDRVWEADSPRQALAWLRLMVDLPGTQIRDVEIDGKPALGLPARPFYRGHSNETWRLEPTLHRVHGQQRAEEERATRIAAAVIDSTFGMLWQGDGAQSWPPLLNSAGRAAAQHYGLKTTLLDWTANPQIAVHFGTSVLEPKPDQPRGCVYWVNAADAERFGLQILLAPPFLQRLYLQRGFFTEVREDQVDELHSVCNKILFPNYPKELVQAIGEDRELYEVDVLPEDRWFDFLVKWSREKAKVVDDGWFDNDGIKLWIAFTAKHGSYPGISDFANFGMLFGEGFYSLARDYIDQLALVHYKGGKRCYSPRVMSLLRRCNPEFFEWAKAQKLEFPELDENFLQA